MPQIPYGNAFIVDTPYLDRVGERLYAEERQREAINRQELSALDNIMAREVGKIRAADTPDYINKYEQYKQFKKQLYDPKLKKTPQEYDKINRAANLAMAEAAQIANRSQEFQDQLKQLSTQKAKDPNSFSDDFVERFNAASNTPVTKLSHPKYGDLSDYNSYIYQGGNTDFTKDLKTAMGIQRDLNEVLQGADPNDKFKNLYKSYKGGNSPYEFYNSLVQGVVGSKKTRDFPLQYKYTPEQEAVIEAQFNQIVNNPSYKAAYKLDQQDFPASAYNTQLGRAARLKAMEYAINNQPSEKSVLRANTEAITSDKQRFAKEQQAIRESNKNYRASLSSRFPDSNYEDYDILGYVAEKYAEPVTIKIQVPGANGTMREIEKTEWRVPAEKIDGNYKKYLGDKSPKAANGKRYYTVTAEGNWEGNGGELIERDVVTQTFHDAKVPIKEKTGVPKPTTPKPKEETIADKMRRLRGQK